MDVFDIKLHGFEDAPGRDPSEDLARAFGIPVDQARRIVARAPVVVKKGVSEDVAERFFRALRDIGAKVTLDKRVVASMAPPGARASVAPPAAPHTSPPSSGPTHPAAHASLPAPPGMAPAPDLDPLDPFDRGFGDASGGSYVGAGQSWGAGGHAGAFDGRTLEPETSDDAGLIDLDVDPRVLASVRPPRAASSAATVGAAYPSRPPSGRPPSMRPLTASSHPPAAAVGYSPAAAASDGAANRVAAPSGFPEPLREQTHGPFLPALLGAFTYPLQKQALVVIIGLAIVSQLLGLIFIIGPLLSGGLVVAYLFAIIRATHNGKDAIPAAADFTDTSDIIGPLIRFILALVVPFAPAVAVAFLLPPGPTMLLGVVLAILAGLVYMPASVILAALGSGCLAPLNPIAGVMIMTRVPGPYALMTMAIAVVVFIDGAVGAAFRTVTQFVFVPILPGIVATAIGLPFSFIAARMLGLFLRHYETDLGLD